MKKMNPTISVIVIGYNIQEYIAKCIDSILCQSFEAFEVIFVNDGSKDNTLEIVSKYKDNITIVDKENGGIVSARKAGLRVANGRYITFVDGDDWLNTDCLKNLYVPIIDEDADIVCSDFYEQDEEGSFSIRLCRTTETSNSFFDGIIYEEIDHHMFPKLYKKEFLIKAGYLNYPEVTMAEDWMSNAFFGTYDPKVRYSDTVNYFYRFNTSSVSRKGGEKILEQIKTLNYMEEFFKKNGLSNCTRVMEYLWFAYVRYYCLGNCKSSVKQEMVKAYRNKGYNYKKNTLCTLSMAQLWKIEKVRLDVILKLPMLIPVFDYIYDILKSVRNNRKKRQDLKYLHNIELLYDSYINDIHCQENGKNFFLIGTSDRSNIGDHAIAYSEMSFLQNQFPDYNTIEITGDTFRNRRKEIKRIINEEDIVCITGGGFLGDLWPDEEYMVNAILEDYPNNKVVIFPQTIFFYDEVDSPFLREKLEKFINHKKLYLTARDRKTYDFYTRYFEESRIGLFPDMALYLEGIQGNDFTNDVMLCLRGDKESIFTKNNQAYLIDLIKRKGLNISYGSTLADGVHNGDIKLSNRKDEIRKKLYEFSKPRLIITDRLHGMVLSTLAGTPCIVFDNLSGKVSGVYNLWLKPIKSIVFLDNVADVDTNILKLFKLGKIKYTPNFLNDDKNRFVLFIHKLLED